eukprot:1136795-Pelagomonas_calceolata.AAC.2
MKEPKAAPLSQVRLRPATLTTVTLMRAPRQEPLQMCSLLTVSSCGGFVAEKTYGSLSRWVYLSIIYEGRVFSVYAVFLSWNDRLPPIRPCERRREMSNWKITDDAGRGAGVPAADLDVGQGAGVLATPFPPLVVVLQEDVRRGADVPAADMAHAFQRGGAAAQGSSGSEKGVKSDRGGGQKHQSSGKKRKERS